MDGNAVAYSVRRNLEKAKQHGEGEAISTQKIVMEPWTPHDLRRTAATNMSALLAHKTWSFKIAEERSRSMFLPCISMAESFFANFSVRSRVAPGVDPRALAGRVPEPL
ncbi:MAG TPA: hypothetical protein DDY22_18775 [Geobacter sp.]|nr:hypothetical protein [Geobacter sp.]